MKEYLTWLFDNEFLFISENFRVMRKKVFRGGAARKETLLSEPVLAGKNVYNGYLQVQYYLDGKRYVISEHRLISFIVKGEWGSEVIHHKDGNKKNNNPNNLESMSYSEHNRLHTKKVWQTLPENADKVKEWKEKTRISRNNNIKIKSLQIYSDKQSGMSTGELAEKYKLCKETIRLRIRHAKRLKGLTK